IPVGSIAGDSSRTINVTFSIDPTATTRNYGVGYSISYRDTTGELFSSSGTFSIPVSGTPSRPMLIASRVSFSPSIVTPGNNFIVSIDIANSGNQPAFGSSISIFPNSEINVVGGTGVTSIGTIGAGENVTVNFEMFTGASAPIGAVPVKFGLIYTNPLGLQFNSTGVFTVALTATPEVKVGIFSINNGPLTPGLSTFLTLSLINVGGTIAYDVALTLSGNSFLIGNSTNYLGAIGNGSTAKASFFLAVSNTTKPGSYTLNIGIFYKDVAGRNYTSDSNYSLQIQPVSPPEVSITNVLLDPPVLSAGTTGSVTLFFKNSGLSDAKNVIIRVVGGTGVISTTYFGLGTITAGGQVTQVIGINVAANLRTGSFTILFNTTYTDLTGKVFSSVNPMQITIYGTSSLLSAANIIVVGGVVVVALVCLFFLRRYKVV
ncbi:MAG: COG1361 S-layer family protein, partial [Nitrososphaerales archaeon]